MNKEGVLFLVSSKEVLSMLQIPAEMGASCLVLDF